MKSSIVGLGATGVGLSFLCVIIWLAGAGPLRATALVSNGPSATVNGVPPASTPGAEAETAPAAVVQSFSPGVREVVKMVDAHVDANVIKQFIKSSPIPFHPTASEIIALKERGVPDEITTAMLNRGAEVRAQMAQSAQASAAANANNAGAAYPYVSPYSTYDYGTPLYGEYPYDDYSAYPNYSYSYSYAYPGWYGGYPWGYYGFYGTYWPFYGYRGYRGHYGYNHGRYGNYAFHHPGNYAYRGSPWAPAGGYHGGGFARPGGGFRPGFGSGGHVGGFGHAGGGFGGHGGGFSGGHGGGHR